MRKYLTRQEAAQYLTERGLRISHRTLAKFASQGGGPTYYKFGFRTLYQPDELMAWAEARAGFARRNTSEVRKKKVIRKRLIRRK